MARRLLGVGLVWGMLAVCTSASAQGVPLSEVSANRFAPAPGRNNYLTVDGSRFGGHLAPSAGIFLDYAHRPFVLYDAQCDGAGSMNCRLEGGSRDLVSAMVTGNVVGSLTLFNRLQIGLLVPVSFSTGDGFAFSRSGTTYALSGGSGVGLGDVRLSAKVRITRDSPEGLGLAVAAWVAAPFGQLTAEHRYLGDHGPTVGGHAIVDFSAGRFHAALNVGGYWRQTELLFSTRVGPQMLYGVGLGFDATPLVTILGEVSGSATFTGQIDENPLEGRLALRYTMNDFALTAGGGAGIVGGVGVPVFRALLGFAWVPDRGDSDGDGLLEREDTCPSEAEDLDGFQDEDGCPDPDNDNDRIPDASDRCPSVAEDRDGENDTDGCPDSDNDHDGVDDGYDSCPSEPEDMDGDRDEDGCPDNDRDRDGIADDVDQCDDQPEDTDGFGDEDGCPETDFDGDQISDDVDQCPDQAEDVDQYEDEDGCPEEGSAGSGRRRRSGR